MSEEKFAAIGLPAIDIKVVLKSEAHVAALEKLMAETDCDATVGRAVHELSVAVVKGTIGDAGRDVLAAFIKTRKISSVKQVKVACKHLKRLGDSPIDEEALSKASGVGVVVSDEQINEIVAKLVQDEAKSWKDKGKLTGKLTQHELLQWGDASLVRAAVITSMTAKLGEEPVKKKAAKKAKGKAKQAAAPEEGKHLLAISVKKDEDFARWYTEILLKAELIDYSDIAGCYILRPWSFGMWEDVTKFLDTSFKSLGVKNCSFPMFVSKSALEAEEDHIEDFQAEVAWVTKAGHSDLAEPIAIRPTSETVMYPIMKNWVRSHRDLPMKFNQWCSVVRWEFKQTVPFLRSREFLWQEGHTLYAEKDGADKEVLDILDFYRGAYEDVLAVPVIKGHKTEKEKFAGGDYTTTVEAFIPTTGRGIQGATSHHLGKNFSRMFDITFEDSNTDTQHVFQNSWGFTTRSIGVALMVHGDDKGVVLPPRCAQIQTVLVPLMYKKSMEQVSAKSEEIFAQLKEAGFRVHLDDRQQYKPGWKYNFWDLRGVPTHIEFGPRDLEKETCVIARRDTGEKIEDVSLAELPARLSALLDQIHNDMLAKARAVQNAHIVTVTEWKYFVPTINKRNLVICPWCKNMECEEEIKKKSSDEAIAIAETDGEGLTAAAKSLCIPFDQSIAGQDLPATCVNCSEKALTWCLFGRSY